ncbi:UNVERIFIED_CONTAM: hypothetical protein Slati_2368700 [Sesamum latifolium]|uniref:Reverse transcriptase domain-containing protein n=1 Tax=Sesamum latifolium TaxID=2727402 RepID=A0AAW2WEX7_9LAMI
MKILSWNCQGLGSPWIVRSLVELIKLHNPSLVFLSETKSFKRRYEGLKERLNYHGVGIDARGKFEELLLLWRKDIEVWIQSYSHNHIMLRLKLTQIRKDGDSLEFMGIRSMRRKAGRQEHSDRSVTFNIALTAADCTTWAIGACRLRGVMGGKHHIQSVLSRSALSKLAHAKAQLEENSKMEELVWKQRAKALATRGRQEHNLFSCKSQRAESEERDPGNSDTWNSGVNGGALSHIIKQAENRGVIQGVPVARQAPRVSHLLFADDAMIFCKASHEAMVEIKGILSTFEAASGFKINLDKSAIVFSRNTPPHICAELASIIGVAVKDKHDKYLGLPSTVGDRKKRCLKDLRTVIGRNSMAGLQSIFHKLAGWC